jgi:hypothetical protein
MGIAPRGEEQSGHGTKRSSRNARRRSASKRWKAGRRRRRQVEHSFSPRRHQGQLVGNLPSRYPNAFVRWEDWSGTQAAHLRTGAALTAHRIAPLYDLGKDRQVLLPQPLEKGWRSAHEQ